MFCRERVARFTDRRAEIESKGAKMVTIGNGTAAMARDFVEKFHVTVPVFTDPSRKTFQAASFLHELGIGFKSVKRGLRAMASGHIQGMNAGDVYQQGGVLALTESGLIWQHADDGPGDQADIDALIAAL